MSFSEVSTMETVYLCLGSNIGDRMGFLTEAANRLSRILHAFRVSSVWETEPMYTTVQPRFLNAVICGKTDLDPESLLSETQRIETTLGRNRREETVKGPRPIDIDIVLFGERALDTPELVIPHPGIYERRFFLVPLLELSPELQDPATGKPIRDILHALPQEGVYSWTSARYNFPRFTRS
jgi:2-amino-4-hydroxy-6-hydroxymethyldihydropteridine diphosphokinase